MDVRKSVRILLIVLLSLTFIASGVFADENSQKAKRTIMLYMCGADLERATGAATHNLKQILGANFSSDEDVRLIIMTGGTKKWKTPGEYLSDPNGIGIDEKDGSYKISAKYNQIWEAKGADSDSAAEGNKHGTLLLLDKDGITGDGETAVESKNELMSKPETLKAFINYCAQYAPAEKYDLILWDHGGGPTGGFAHDEHVKKSPSMALSGIMEALRDNDVTNRTDEDPTNDAHFDFIDFDACLMNSVELNLTMADLTDYYIASAETEPGMGQDYTGWLNEVGKAPEIDTFKLGKKIVDDYVAFYSTGQGKGQGGTLAVVDLRKLMSSDCEFLQGVSDLAATLKYQTRTPRDDQYLFYDEFASSIGCIRYGKKSFFDLGNFAGQLAGTGKDVEAGQDAADNPYLEPAKRILTVLDDQNIIYSGSTEEIRANARFSYDKNGKLRYDDFRSSGMYLFFPGMDRLNDTVKYCKEMTDALGQMPAEAQARKDMLGTYLGAVADYALIAETGKAVSAIASKSEQQSGPISYAVVKDYWENLKSPERKSEWDSVASPLLTYAGGEEAAKSWLDAVIAQQAGEAVSPENAAAYTVRNKNNSRDLRIVLSDTQKRVVEDVSLSVTADLPAAETYAEENEYEGDYLDMLLAWPIGHIKGTENMDEFDITYPSTPESFKADYLKWYYSGKSTWDVPRAENKWYAVRDGDAEGGLEGGLHAASVSFEGDRVIVPFTYPDEEAGEDSQDSEHINTGDFVFEDSGNGYALSQIGLIVDGEQRYFKASELDIDLTGVKTVYMADLIGGFPDPIPMTKNSFTVTPDNVSDITLEYDDISEISDITELHKKYVVRDIYLQETDISAKASSPVGELVNISMATVQPAVYSGKALRPVIKYNGRVLKEGTDYTLIKLTNQKSLINVGGYMISLRGKGSFCGVDVKQFTITKAGNPLKVKGKTVKVKYKKVKKKKQVLKASKLYKFTRKAGDKKTYTLLSAKKKSKSFKKYFKVNKNNGKITVKKGIRKGSYKLRIRIKAGGNKNYKAGSKAVTVTVRVR